jgi:hypothetical protein
MRKLAIIIILSCWAAPGAAAEDLLVFTDPVLVKGEAHVISLAKIAEAPLFLSVTYRPNSATELTEEPAAFDGDGMITWTPQAAGIATLSVVGADGAILGRKDVSICFSGIPAGGILTMVLAGILLFGGAACSLVMALRKLPAHD